MDKAAFDSNQLVDDMLNNSIDRYLHRLHVTFSFDFTCDYAAPFAQTTLLCIYRYSLYTFHTLEFHFNKYDNLWYRYLGLVDFVIDTNKWYCGVQFN